MKFRDHIVISLFLLNSITFKYFVIINLQIKVIRTYTIEILEMLVGKFKKLHNIIGKN